MSFLESSHRRGGSSTMYLIIVRKVVDFVCFSSSFERRFATTYEQHLFRQRQTLITDSSAQNKHLKKWWDWCFYNARILTICPLCSISSVRSWRKVPCSQSLGCCLQSATRASGRRLCCWVNSQPQSPTTRPGLCSGEQSPL